MGFQFHSICEYKAIRVLFLHPMRMLDPKAKAASLLNDRDEESSQMALQCPNMGPMEFPCTSSFRAGWYGTVAGDGEGIQKNGFKASDVSRCWGASAAALHFLEPKIWPWVHDQEIMYDFVVSSWEMGSDRTHTGFWLNQEESSIIYVSQNRSPPTSILTSNVASFAILHDIQVKESKVCWLDYQRGAVYSKFSRYY